jgi:hypothetical protein
MLQRTFWPGTVSSTLYWLTGLIEEAHRMSVRRVESVMAASSVASATSFMTFWKRAIPRTARIEAIWPKWPGRLAQ